MGVYSCGAPIEPKVLTLSAASARMTLPAGSAFRLVSDIACWLSFGDVTVASVVGTAPAMYLPANFEFVIAKPGVGAATAQKSPTHVSAIAAGAGNLSVVGLA
jgi:hypothetical protein